MTIANELTKRELDLILFKKLLPNLSKQKILNYIKHMRAKKLFLKYGNIMDRTEQDYKLVNSEISKLNEGEIAKTWKPILNNLKKQKEETELFLTEFEGLIEK